MLLRFLTMLEDLKHMRKNKVCFGVTNRKISDMNCDDISEMIISPIYPISVQG